MSDKLTIGKKEYDIEEKELLQSDLCLYPENPRVYSALNISDGNPTQEEIEEIMTNMEHVKQLRVSIIANGGLIDPLIVKNGDFVVLEGNSRLAAYRILAKQDAIKWGKVKCKILPDDIPEAAIFTLLGQYHIIGRKDWSPYEQAGYLYRRTKTSNTDVEFIAKELGLNLATAKSHINVYSFMIENDDLTPDRWSYYEEYLKNTYLKKYRETNLNLDTTIVQKIKSGEITKAIDIRNKLGVIAKIKSKSAKKIMAEISEGKTDIYDGFDRIEDTGKTGYAYQALYKFRLKINDQDFSKDLLNGKHEEIIFELKKIKTKIETLIKDFSK